MTYGTSSLDVTKGLVLLSCAFPVFMAGLIFADPAYLIASERGMGWWDVLQEHHDTSNDADAVYDPRVFVYPRIWGYRLLLELAVRLNWIFTVETQPALYRCVLLTYVLPAVQYAAECLVYQTLPPFDLVEMLIFNAPWFFLVYSYRAYTAETKVAAGKDQKKA